MAFFDNIKVFKNIIIFINYLQYFYLFESFLMYVAFKVLLFVTYSIIQDIISSEM